MKEKTATSALAWKPTKMEPHRSPKEGFRSLQTSSKTNKTQHRTSTTILLEEFKLETPRNNNKKAQTTNIKPQDDWQRQLETINIEFKQLTTEPDYTSQTPRNSDNNEPSIESYYELMRDAPDKCLPDTTQTISTHTDISPEIHHPNTFSCNKNSFFSMKTSQTTSSLIRMATCHTYQIQPL